MFLTGEQIKNIGSIQLSSKCYIPAGTFFHFYLLSIAHFLIHSSFFDHVNFRLSVPIILVVANDGLAIGSPNLCLLCEVSLIVLCFVSLLIFISLTKIVLAISKQIVMSSRVSFQMPMGGWTKWNSKSKLVQDLEAMMCTGLLDGKSALEIQTEHPAYQIFNLTNFPNNVSHLQSKLGLESAATVTFSSPQVVPSHSPPPSFVQAHPCLESQAMQPLHDPRSMS